MSFINVKSMVIVIDFFQKYASIGLGKKFIFLIFKIVDN